jgi:AraC family transcriptional regulator, transcriptional activator of pobA
LRPAPFLQLYDPRNGDLSLRVDPLDTPDDLSAPQRTNFFTVFWIQEGQGTFCAESGEYPFAAQSLLFLVPYQSFKFISGPGFRGLCLRFHANFLCIETYHEEVGCNGILFNDTYGVPCVNLEECHAQEAAALLDEISRELREGGLAHSEVLLSYLKIFLVRATRLKMQQQELASAPPGRIPEVLTNLKRLIEEHFRTRHAPADYAAMLHIVPKSLARLVRMHLNKTLTELIRERIIRQAKWELLHTQKPVKDVAAGLGFEDIFYFSRLFKRSTGCSPTFFREFETEIRGGRNLSMR